MLAKLLTPILNVSDIQQRFAWFEKLGWKKAWDWGSPPDFGCVCSGECSIFLSLNSQGGRGKGAVETTFGPEGDEAPARRRANDYRRTQSWRRACTAETGKTAEGGPNGGRRSRKRDWSRA
jgi:hypothetical protein